MLYLNQSHIDQIGIDWHPIIDMIKEATKSLRSNDFAQPIKPYLRYRDHTNRIIAMPAFVGGHIDMAGIKWIASFPGNIDKGLNRANSVTILNESHTGRPLGIINTTKISGIRTAAVTGLVLREYLHYIKTPHKLKVGMTGFGPIGKLHIDMISTLLADRLNQIYLYDVRPVDKDAIDEKHRTKVTVCSSWEEAFADADVFVTCTVSKKQYINKAPRRGSLHLNVSLRDYEPAFLNHVNLMLVDDWAEVCREKTDIELMHEQFGLQKEGTRSIADVVCEDTLASIKPGDVVMFNPMGMAIYDIAVGKYYYDLAEKTQVGQLLEN